MTEQEIQFLFRHAGNNAASRTLAECIALFYQKNNIPLIEDDQTNEPEQENHPA